MANGENRAKIKESASKTAQSVDKGIKNIGKGIKDFTLGTVDAILNPLTIPEKLETCFDNVIVTPTLRAVDFIDESAHKVMSETDKAFNAQVKQAQHGARHLKVVFAQPLDMNTLSFVAKSYPKSEDDRALIDAALKDNFVFSHLTSHKRSKLISAFEPIIAKKGSKIIEEGDVGDYFYVVGSGDVDFKIGHIVHHMLFQHDVMMHLHSVVSKQWGVSTLWKAFKLCAMQEFCKSRIAEYELYHAFVYHNYPERVRHETLTNGKDYMASSAMCDAKEMGCCEERGVLLKGCHDHRVRIWRGNPKSPTSMGDMCCSNQAYGPNDAMAIHGGLLVHGL